MRLAEKTTAVLVEAVKDDNFIHVHLIVEGLIKKLHQKGSREFQWSKQQFLMNTTIDGKRTVPQLAYSCKALKVLHYCERNGVEITTSR